MRLPNLPNGLRTNFVIFIVFHLILRVCFVSSFIGCRLPQAICEKRNRIADDVLRKISEEASRSVDNGRLISGNLPVANAYAVVQKYGLNVRITPDNVRIENSTRPTFAYAPLDAPSAQGKGIATFKLANASFKVNGDLSYKNLAQLATIMGLQTAQGPFELTISSATISLDGVFYRGRFSGKPDFKQSGEPGSKFCAVQHAGIRLSIAATGRLVKSVLSTHGAEAKIQSMLSKVVESYICDSLLKLVRVTASTLPPPFAAGLWLMMPKFDANVFIATWNVMGKYPPPDHNLDKWLLPPRKPRIKPDIYVICLQEVVPLTATSAISRFVYTDRRPGQWTKAVLFTIGEDYVPLSEPIRMMGIFIQLFVLREMKLAPTLLDHFETTTKPTGLKGPGWLAGLGKLGNKGAVAVSLTFLNTPLLFTSVHLEAFEGKSHWDIRNRQFEIINNGLQFSASNQVQSAADHDAIFFTGDMNYRLVRSASLDESSLLQLIQEKNFSEILKHDQLSISRNDSVDKAVFAGYQEGFISFPPTYKYHVSNFNYDMTKRFPSYCDRILWRDNVSLRKVRHSEKHSETDQPASSIVIASDQSEVPIPSIDSSGETPPIVRQLAYNHVRFANLSDHMPIYALFEITVF